MIYSVGGKGAWAAIGPDFIDKIAKVCDDETLQWLRDSIEEGKIYLLAEHEELIIMEDFNDEIN